MLLSRLAAAINWPFFENFTSMMAFWPQMCCLGMNSSQSYLMMIFPSSVPAATTKPPSSSVRQAIEVIGWPTLQISMSSCVWMSKLHTTPLSPPIMMVCSVWLSIVRALLCRPIIRTTVFIRCAFIVLELPASVSITSMTSPLIVVTRMRF